MPNENEAISKKALRRLLKITTDESSHLDVKNKLEIMAVKAGIKPVFLETSEGSYLNTLEWAATLLNLKYKLTELPPPYFSRKPNVDPSFLNVWGKDEIKAIWIYRDVRAEPLISKSVTGRLNDGHVFGYPACCIKWHEESRTRQVEAEFQDIQEYISENPPELMDLQSKTMEETYLALMKTPFSKRHWDEVLQSVGMHVIETYERYPFVPHWACSSCLSGESRETERLNDQFRELAEKLDPKFARKIVDTVLKWAKTQKSD